MTLQGRNFDIFSGLTPLSLPGSGMKETIATCLYARVELYLPGACFECRNSWVIIGSFAFSAIGL
jgi:hypothetical protein